MLVDLSLPKLARKCLEYYFKQNKKITISKFLKELKDSSEISVLSSFQAIFITLTINKELRGCIGSLFAYRSLAEEIIEHSYNAAFLDNRFEPLTNIELDKIKIEVSVLSPKTLIHYTSVQDLYSKITPLVDGIYLTNGNRSATFLPQVWESLPKHQDFFLHLCYKAGLSLSILEDKNTIVEKYTVQLFEEK